MTGRLQAAAARELTGAQRRMACGPHNLPNTLPLIIRQMRAYHGWTYRGLATRVGMSQTQMRYLELGKSAPTLATFIALCQVLELSPVTVMAAITGEARDAAPPR